MPGASEDRADPINPTSRFHGRIYRRPQAAGGVGARTGDWGFETNHDGIKRREQARRKWADRMETKEDTQQRNHDERGDRFAQQSNFERIAFSRPSRAEKKRFAPLLPRPRAAANRELHQEVGRRCTRTLWTSRASPLTKGHRDDRIDMRSASFPCWRKSDRSPGCAKEKTRN